MRLTTTRTALQAALAQTVSVAPTRTTLPILGHVLIEAGDGLTVSATDLDRAIVVRARADVAEPGRIAVPAKTLAELAKTLGDKPITLVREGDRLAVKSGRTLARLPIADADDFPALPVVDMAEATQIDAGAFADLIHRTAFASSDEQSRPILNGALIHAHSGRLRVVATNGHRLGAAYGPDAGEWADVIVPNAGLDTIGRTLRGVSGPVRVAVGESYMAIAAEGATVYSRLVEGPYPNYEQVIPKEHTTEATIDRAALLATIRRALVVASEVNHRLRFEWGAESVQVSAQTPDMGEMSEAVECQTEGPGLTIGFNGSYLVEILSRIATDEVVVRMTSAERAAVIVPAGQDDVLYLVMPLRLLD